LPWLADPELVLPFIAIISVARIRRPSIRLMRCLMMSGKGGPSRFGPTRSQDHLPAALQLVDPAPMERRRRAVRPSGHQEGFSPNHESFRP
jgi:hypothetical protein